MDDSYQKLEDDDQQKEPTKSKSLLKRTFQSSNIIKFLYSFYIILGFILSLLGRDNFYGFFNLIFPHNRFIPNKNTTLWDSFCTSYYNKLKVSCSGSFWVYRISFTCVMFFGFNCFFTSRLFFCVFGSNKSKLYLQKNCCFWVIRFMIFMVFLIIPFFIPDCFFYGYGIIAIIVSAGFLIIQMIILIDFAYSWQERWLNSDGDEEDDGYGYGESGSGNGKKNIWQWGLMLFSFGFMGLGVLFFVSEIILFGIVKHCHINRILIITTAIIGFILTILTLVRGKGLLPASIIFCYSGFAVYSTLGSSVDLSGCSTFPQFFSPSGTNSISQIIGIIFSVACALFTVVKMVFSTSLSEFCSCKREQKLGEEEIDEEYIQIRHVFYNLIVFILVSFYFPVILNNWMVSISSSSRVEKFSIEVSIYAFVVKWVSIGIMFILYGWSLLAKYILSCRDFGDDDDDD